MLTTGLVALPATSEAPGDLQAGTAKAEITPPVTTPMFAYTARHMMLATGEDLSDQMYPRYVDQKDDGVDTELYGKTFLESEGVHTRLYAQATVLDDGDTEMAFVLTDLGALPGEVHQAVADRLADQAIDIPRENLMIGATHTHGGPGGFFADQGYALIGGDSFDPRIFERVVSGITKAIVDAHADKQPATLAIGTTEITDASRQRSTDAHVAGHSHDSDHKQERARVLRIDAADGGPPLGVITTFAAHGTIVGSDDLLITGDNQGVAARLVARGIAEASPQVASEHDVVVTYLNGAQGDISPVGSGDTFIDSAEDSGERQAPPLLAAWEALEGQGTRDVELDSRFKFLCFCGQEVQDGQRISTIPILGAEGTDPFPNAGFPGHDPKVPFLVGPGLVPQVVRLQVVQINDHVMVAVPGEPSMALGQQIEEEILAMDDVAEPASTVDVIGLANDYISYMSTLPEYDVQAYEGSFNLYGRMTGPLFQQELTAMAHALLDDQPVEEAYQGVIDRSEPPVLPGADQLDLVPGASPDQVLEQAADAAAGQSVRLAWLGGSPAVDHPLDQPMVQVVDMETGEVVLDDRGFELQVRYDKVGTDEHRWSVTWPVEESVEPGSYRFEVTGRYVDQPGQTASYTYTSAPFQVTG